MELTKEGLVTTETREGVLVVNFLQGRIREEREILKTLEELGRHADSTVGPKILIDMKNIEYLSSAGLGNLVSLLKKCRKTGGGFKLCNLQASVLELFQVMRLDKIFEIFDNKAVALKSFSL